MMIMKCTYTQSRNIRNQTQIAKVHSEKLVGVRHPISGIVFNTHAVRESCYCVKVSRYIKCVELFQSNE